jgi:hypothetical protein
MGDKPWAPPLVEMSGGNVGHLLEWRQHERDGVWWAWVSWVQTAGDRPKRMVVEVRAASLRPIEAPEAYAGVPRRVLGRNGRTQPWTSKGLGGRGLKLPPARSAALSLHQPGELGRDCSGRGTGPARGVEHGDRVEVVPPVRHLAVLDGNDGGKAIVVRPACLH